DNRQDIRYLPDVFGARTHDALPLANYRCSDIVWSATEEEVPGVMRRTALFAALSATVVVTTLAGTAMAESAHFVKVSASIGNPNIIGNPELRVSFKEAGLGDNAIIIYGVTADATAVYACINGGSKHPQATNKETVSGPVSGSGSFTSSKNGTVTGTVQVAPPGPGDFACPSGQSLVVASVSYSNVVLTDTTNNVTETLPGPFSKTFFNV